MTGIPMVVGYDGSPSADEALRWAAIEAARADTPLRVVHVLEWPTQVAAVAPGPPIYPDQGTQQAAQRLVREAVCGARRQQPDLTVSGRVRIGAVVPELVAESQESSAVVLGHRGHDGRAAGLLGSVGVSVSAHAHCPVVIVTPGWADPRRVDEVVVGFDGSPCSARAVGVAFRAAEARGIGVRVLHAWRPPAPRWRAPQPTVDSAGVWSDEPTERLALAEHLAVVDALQLWRRRFPRASVAVDLVADSAGHALIAASARARLLVVGSCGHGNLRGLLFGSVSQQLVHHAGCPVVVVHELPHEEVDAATAN